LDYNVPAQGTSVRTNTSTGAQSKYMAIRTANSEIAKATQTSHKTAID